MMEELAHASAEERFVRTFIRPERRERLLYELTTPKKRGRGLERFCHGAGDLLDPGKIRLRGEDMDRSPAFQAFAEEHDGSCLLLSPDGTIDGLTFPFREAVGIAAVWSDAVVIVGDGFALVYGEPEKGGREKVLLTE